jgi:hypothetical protein
MMLKLPLFSSPSAYQEMRFFMRKKVSLTLIILVLLFGVFSCDVFPKEEKIVGDTQIYTYDPLTVLEKIKRKDKDILIPFPDDKELELPPEEERIPIEWSQADYFLFLDYIFTSIWEDTRANWQFSDMSFSTSCNRLHGFDGADFQFYKNIKIENKQGESRLVRRVGFNARMKVVFVTKEEYYPRPGSWDMINSDKIEITAEKALEIADSQGGKEKRSSVDNRCSIYISFSPLYTEFGWLVKYEPFSLDQVLSQYLVKPY